MMIDDDRPRIRPRRSIESSVRPRRMLDLGGLTLTFEV